MFFARWSTLAKKSVKSHQHSKKSLLMYCPSSLLNFCETKVLMSSGVAPDGTQSLIQPHRRLKAPFCASVAVAHVMSFG